MTTEEKTLAEIKAQIDALPEDQREQVLNYVREMKKIFEEKGPLALCAVALIGAELAAEE